MIKKDTGISLGALAIIVPMLFWFVTTKADKVMVEKMDEEVDQEENINIQQQGLIDSNTKLIERQTKLLDILLEKAQ